MQIKLVRTQLAKTPLPALVTKWKAITAPNFSKHSQQLIALMIAQGPALPCGRRNARQRGMVVNPRTSSLEAVRPLT